jgi:hypothetical protein
MKSIFEIFKARRSATAMLVVGVFAGIIIGGGVGVVASSSSKSVTVCVNKANFMRYSKTNRCAAGETRVAIGQTGAQGPQGATGDAGTKGDTGAAGTKGATGDAGTKGDTGAAGTKGATGDAGTKGDTGEAGTKGTTGDAGSSGVIIAPQAVCDGGDANTTFDETCKIGMTGPGGGLIFFVDDYNEFETYDYLEAAPTDALFASGASTAMWATSNVNTCGPLRNQACLTYSMYTETNVALATILGRHRGLFGGKAATEAIVARHDAGSIAKNTYAAGAADAYEANGKTDWWLPSKDEMGKMAENLSNRGLGSFSSNSYWTSSETVAENTAAWSQNFYFDRQLSQTKNNSFSVRPVRAF